MHAEKRPKVTYMGQELAWEDLPDGGAIEITDYFKPVRLSILAINQTSQIVPEEHYKKEGICTWLSRRADYVFSRLPSDKREGRLRTLKYYFEFQSDGPVLVKISL